MTSTHTLKRFLTAAAALAIAAAAIGCGSADEATTEDTSSNGDALTGNDKTAYEFFHARGLKNYQAAAIVGNLIQESSVNPHAIQFGGGPGRGIAQWSVGGRWDADHDDNAHWYAAKEGESVWSLDLQLKFVWYELETFSGYGLHELKSSSNVVQATVDFQDRFEGCGQCDQSKRISYAEQVLKAYGH
jgi:hypothetical protein